MKTEIQVTNESTAKIVFDNYIKDNKENYRIEKIREANYELLQSQRNSIYDCLNLGRLFFEALENFNSPVNKQLRKELGLKISVDYFISQAYGFSKAWVYRLIQAYKLGEDIKQEYLNSGNVDKELSIAGLLKFANKEEESTEEESEESTEESTEEESEEASEQITKFGGITISIDKAAKDDILKAIEYLQNLAK